MPSQTAPRPSRFQPLDGTWFMPALFALLLAPHLFFGPPNRWWTPLRFGMPRATSGDEPHYLVMLNSILRDGDLDLRNNYDSALRGSNDAGAEHSRDPIEHHVGYYIGGQYVDWRQIFDARRPWVDDGRRIRFAHRPGATRLADDLPEYSIHPPGLPLILAALLWPVRQSERLESFALVISGLVTCAAAWCFRRLLLDLGAAAGWANACTMLAFLATPVWHYGRTLFGEPYLLFFGVFSYQAVLASRGREIARPLLAGIALGLGIMIKPPFALLAPSLGAFLLVGRRWRSLAFFSLPLASAVAATLAANAIYFGSPFHPPQPWRTGNFWSGLFGLYTWWDKSLFLYAPAIVVPLAAWPRFARSAGVRARVILGGFLPYASLMLLWEGWHGGYSYGPRLFIPLLPLIFAAAAAYPEASSAPAIRPWARRTVGFLVLFSFAVNAAAIVYFQGFWRGLPLLQ